MTEWKCIMPDQVTFKCLRCGNEFRGIYDTDMERMCPQCRSNSVRRVKDKDKLPPQTDTQGRGEANTTTRDPG